MKQINALGLVKYMAELAEHSCLSLYGETSYTLRNNVVSIYINSQWFAFKKLFTVWYVVYGYTDI